MAGNQQTGEITLAAAIRRYFDVALFLLIFTGFGTLASTGGIDLPTVVLVTEALLFRGYVLACCRLVLLFPRWTNMLSLSYIGCILPLAVLMYRLVLGWFIIHC